MSPRLTNEEFLSRAQEIWGQKYDYSRVQYVDAFAAMEIRCTECDRWFSTSYQGHVLRKRGCSKCSGRISRNGSRRMTTEDFVARAVEVHGHKYSYDKTQYGGARSKVTIYCPKHSFFTQVACEHLSGYGCQKCGAEGRKAARRAEAERNAAAFVANAKGERAVAAWLESHGIPFETQWTPRGLVFGRRLRYDFYTNEMLIEFDGVQHFESISFFGGEKALRELQERDLLKTRWAHENNIRLVRINHTQIEKISDILSGTFSLEVAS